MAPIDRTLVRIKLGSRLFTDVSLQAKQCGLAVEIFCGQVVESFVAERRLDASEVARLNSMRGSPAVVEPPEDAAEELEPPESDESEQAEAGDAMCQTRYR
jgi:hypothetical protein